MLSKDRDLDKEYNPNNLGEIKTNPHRKRI